MRSGAAGAEGWGCGAPPACARCITAARYHPSLIGDRYLGRRYGNFTWVRWAMGILCYLSSTSMIPPSQQKIKHIKYLHPKKIICFSLYSTFSNSATFEVLLEMTEVIPICMRMYGVATAISVLSDFSSQVSDS